MIGDFNVISIGAEVPAKIDLVTKTVASERKKIAIPTLNYWIKKGKIRQYAENGKVKVDWNQVRLLDFPAAKAMRNRAIEQGAAEQAEKPKPSSAIPLSVSGDMLDEEDANVPETDEFLRLRKLQEAEFKQKDFKARQTELEYRKAAGELIPVTTVLRRWENLAQLLKKRIRALPARLGPVMAGEIDPRRCTLLLEQELDQLLENLNEEAIENYGGAIDDSGEIIDESAEVTRDNS
jgi:hypothetical protein